MNLAEKYRPRTLDDLYGQDRARDFFKSVIKNIATAPRYYMISGSYGNGKTALVRAFAHDLLGSLSPPNYLEVDSGEKSLQEDFSPLRDLLFQEVGGMKVAVLDESHLLNSASQSMLLKVVEDYYGPLVIFFVTTDPHLVLDTLRSRLHCFSLSLFTDAQLVEYGRGVAEMEGASVSDRALWLAALNARGHMRNMVKGVELVLFQGEEAFLESYSSVVKGVEDYFGAWGLGDKEAVGALARHHPSELRSLVGWFWREEVINPSGRLRDSIPRSAVPRMYANYLRLCGLAREPDDYFSVLLLCRQAMRAAGGAG